MLIGDFPLDTYMSFKVNLYAIFKLISPADFYKKYLYETYHFNPRMHLYGSRRFGWNTPSRCHDLQSCDKNPVVCCHSFLPC